MAKVDATLVKTVSLAGTQVFNENEKVVWREKEKNEQQIVTDYIAETLLKIADKISVSAPYTFIAGKLAHLKSDIQAEVSEQFKTDFLTNLLHPTPAVCGFPKANAMQFILENEKYDREFYSGFVGEWQKDFLTFKPNNSDLFVNLRCAKIENKIAHIYVGCGVTKDSNAANEFLETQNKMQTILKVLN